LHHHAYDLERLGWTAELSAVFEPHAGDGLAAGRVGAQHRGAFVLYTDRGDLWAEPSGRLRRSLAPDDFPAVGDWVVARPLPGERRAVIEAVLPRRTAFVRNDADVTRVSGGGSRAQVIAANIDVCFCVSALVHDLSLRRLERYLTTAWQSGADPIVVLTKADLCDDVPARLAEVESIAIGVPVVAVSNLTGEGIDGLRKPLGENRTAGLLGSSGVGKSSLVNRLLGEDVQAVRELRGDGRGRHTTTRRELFLLPGGGLVLDTPGLRVLQLLDADSGLGTAFRDVEELAARCRFGDCGHETEPGCAVRAAIDSGVLGGERLASYRRLQRELAFAERKGDKRAESEERRRWRALQREYRRRDQARRRWR
jgi:ribosome biogenesis GTPase